MKGIKRIIAPLKFYSQECSADNWAMANMNMILHDIEGVSGNTFKSPKIRSKGKLRTLDWIVDHEELRKNDYNISPSRYIQTSNAETYRPIVEIVQELNVIEQEAQETDKAPREILKQLGVGA